MSSTMFAIVDCNNFFASCEEVFNPKLKRKPLVILSNNDGIVIARSQKAKEIGIPMGAPVFEIKPLIDSHAVETLSSNFALYADMSNRVMQVLETVAPEIEIYSIDEAFFQVDKEDLVAIREKVKQWTGITVSLGVAPTKTLAKLANRTAKKSKEGVFALKEAGAIRAQLEITPLEEIWGIGAATAKSLKRENVYTPAQLCDKSDEWIRKQLGVNGLRIAMELRGSPCLELEEPTKKQSIVFSRSFGSKIDQLPLLEEAVSFFAARAAEKLRGQESKTKFLSVSLATSLFESHSCHFKFSNATAYAPEIIAKAKEGLSRLFRSGVSYRKAGVMLSDFSDEEVCQFDLFAPDPKREKKEAAMRALDGINARYDKPALRFLAEGKEWKGAPARITPCYTTSWNDILTIRN